MPALHVDVTPLTAAEIVARLPSLYRQESAYIIAAHNLHSSYLANSDATFAQHYDAFHIILIDGWPVLALLNRERRRINQPKLSSDYRIGTTDWLPLAVQAPELERLCVVGASKDSNRAFVAAINKERPDLEILAIPGDPWTEDVQAIARRVAGFDPQLTIVGMGMPLQEGICREFALHGVSGAIAPVGGAIDQLSGQQSLAPRWTGALRIEWLWRLASNPRRLAYRYLIEPAKLVRLLAKKERDAQD